MRDVGAALQGQAQRAQVTDRNDQSSRGFVLQMPAYKNDVLNALLQTGGIPGVNAKPEIRILEATGLIMNAATCRPVSFTVRLKQISLRSDRFQT